MSAAARLWSNADTGQRVILGVIGAAMVFVFVFVIGNLAVNGANIATVVLVLVPGVTAIGLQVYFIRRVLYDWSGMSEMARWGNGFAAAIVPLAAGFVAPLVLVVAVIVWVRAGFPVGGFGSSSPRSAGSESGFGSWWGDRVLNGSDGRPIRVGDEEVKYGADGKPVWVGDREVTYGVDGRMAWVGDAEVVHGGDGSSPKWIGDQEVSLDGWSSLTVGEESVAGTKRPPGSVRHPVRVGSRRYLRGRGRRRSEPRECR